MPAKLMFYGLWLTPPLLMLGLATILVRRGLRRDYPFFFSYLVYQVAIIPLHLFFYHRPGDEYFYVYWATAAISPILGLSVIYELFQHAFKPFEEMRHLPQTLFRWAAVLAALMLVVFAVSVAGAITDRILASVLVVQRSLRVMQIALLLLMMLFAARLGLTWRHHIMAIAAGFGIFASVDLLITSVVPRVAVEWHPALSSLKSSVYLGTVVIWFASLYRTEPERVPELRPVAVPEQEPAFSFALPESSLPPPPDSLLMSMEKMVERRLNGHANGHGNGNGNGAGHKHKEKEDKGGGPIQ